FAHPFIKKITSLQKKLADKVGKKKVSVKVAENNSQLEKVIREKMEPKVKDLYGKGNKEEKSETAKKLISSIHEELLGDNPELTVNEVKNVFFLLEEEVMRTNILEKDMRPDGRGLKEIRPIDCKVRVLPRTHGSAIFTRGQTQALAVITLGTSSDEQLIEALEGKQYKNFMMHYAFPPFSVGEIKPLRGPSRRDVGHGALAEKALSSILPTKEEFPYTIRVVSEILESNGSSSMATVCAASLSLMDTGVPIKAAIAGIALGLVKGKDKYKVLTDIAGIEDHYGDMDLKIAGTKKGVSAIQMDIKIDGLSFEILEQAFDQAKEGRHFILEKMAKALEAPMPALSKYAPKIKSFKIDQDKIGTVIGPGGRMIRRLTRDYNVSIDIDDETNTVSVVAQTEDDLERAIMQISNLVRDIEVGDVYEGKVERLVNFGAFCEIVPGKSGLVRISEVSDTFVKDVNDVLKEGDIVKVKVIGIDPQGRINLSIKQA
ncbi:MAG: polyribonucleotide nucleotidyltransferase, partial [Candidatus Omnitrophota bacterium]